MSDPAKPFSRLAEELIGDFRGIAPKEPRRQVKRPTQPVGNVIDGLLDKYRIGREAPEHVIREHWTELVGSANAAYSHPLHIERGRLTVLASHSVVRNELFMHRAALLAKVRQLPGCKEVRQVMVRAG
ncbi:MAG: DUF721 domain-containing protein [Opitutaceae bacterium]|nr:DUF721 domain-containing protein [Opitutaceae bacterium]